MNKHLISGLIVLLAGHLNAGAQGYNPETIAKMEKQIAVLEAKVEDLTTRLPFRQMAVMTLEANENNMTSGTTQEGNIYYRHDIKIDNPLSNNNPKAIIMVTRQQPGPESRVADVQAINVFYNARDNYWYLRVPDKKIQGLIPGLVIYGVLNAQRQIDKQLYGEILPTTDRIYGVAYAEGISPAMGEKYSVVIFDELDTPMKPKPVPPDYQPPTPTEQPPPTPAKNPYDISVDGEWQYKMSSASGSVFTGKVFIIINGTQVTGILFPPDKSQTAIAGTFNNNILSLQRPTGLETTQVYELTRTAARRFAGTYVNKGKYPDSGTIEFYR